MSRQTWPPRPSRVLAGHADGVSSAGFTTVNFPSGYFTTPPIVTATGRGGVTVYLQADATTSGFGVATSSAVASRVDWIAVQP